MACTTDPLRHARAALGLLSSLCFLTTDQLGEMLYREQITLSAESTDHALSDSRNKGVMTEFLAPMNVSDMHLEDWKFARVQRI